MKYMMSVCLLLLYLIAATQNNFTYTPEKPRPGDVIHFTYTPAGSLSGLQKTPEAFIVESSPGGNKLTDIALTGSYQKWKGTFTTDSSTVFVALGFMNDGKYDVNNDLGYTIQLFNGDKPASNSWALSSNFYSSWGKNRLGILVNNEKALEHLENEMKYYPENTASQIKQYYKILLKVNLVKGTEAVQNDIEQNIKHLETEADYTRISDLYAILRLTAQRNFIDSLRKLRYPSKNNREVELLYADFSTETDWATKQHIFSKVKALVNENNYSINYDNIIASMAKTMAVAYIAKGDMYNFKNAASHITNNYNKYLLYCMEALKLVKIKDKLKDAEMLTREAMMWAKAAMENPAELQPAMTTAAEWKTARMKNYTELAHYYIKVLYISGKYKEGITYAKEIALILHNGENGNYNNTYLSYAQKIMPVNEVKLLAENFLIAGKSGEYPKLILKDIYIQQKKSDSGFNDYIKKVENKKEDKKIAALKSEILNIPAPQFTLTDIEGKTVRLADYAGKVIVLDFWATWCAPCKASFPGMQKMVDRYKNDMGVKFLFIDTWEQGGETLKSVADFINTHKYTFHVLMDSNSNVVKDYRVGGIPVKFIIGKDGKIKFKDAGYRGDAELAEKLPLLIQLAAE